MVLIVESGVWYRCLLLISRIVDVFIVVTNGTATNVDGDIATTFIVISRSILRTWVRIRAVVLVVWTQDTVGLDCLFIFRNLFIHQIETISYRSKTTTAIDGAQYLTALDVQFDRTTDITGSQRLTTEATATTEYITIISLTDVYNRILEYVTILTSAKDGTIDSAALDVDKSTVHIRFLVEEDTLVTLTCTKDIACIRMCHDLSNGTWHTYGTTCHRDGSRALYIRSLTTTIDICYDMTASDIDSGLTLYATCRAQIFTDAVCCVEIRNTTRAAAKHITIVGMTVGSLQSSAIR